MSISLKAYAILSCASLLFLCLAFQTSLGQQVAPGVTKVRKKSIAFIPYYHPRAACHPVEVKFVSLGGQPQHVLLAQVTIESFSDTPVSVFVDQPLIVWDQVKSLTDDGTPKTLRDDYTILLYVSEVTFSDGAKWEGNMK